MDSPPAPRRRRFSSALKAEVLDACRRPGASLPAIAQSHGLTPDRIRRWLRGQGVSKLAPGSDAQPGFLPGFLPVRLSPTTPPHTPLRIEVTRGNTLIKIDWPASSAAVFSNWLKEWLQ